MSRPPAPGPLRPWLALLALLPGGCAFPVRPAPPPSSPGALSQAALLGAGAAAGGFLGDRVDGRTGALIGGAAGLAGAALVNRAETVESGTEALEQARREERLKIMQRFWYDRTLSPDRESGSAPAPDLLEYPAGDYSGMNFAPRLAADPSLAEPDR